ncbi:hypothetical protein ABR737_02455 [Streptomyces sp. Edi2]|uniref:hypothetical protein n=1 Tax=Streptomyces sp. Edi2 TaxID=3162528 RepID=UPI00330574FF
MPNRTHGREFERSLQRTKAAARGAEQARAAASLITLGTEGTISNPSVNVNSCLGGA